MNFSENADFAYCDLLGCGGLRVKGWMVGRIDVVAGLPGCFSALRANEIPLFPPKITNKVNYLQ